MGRFVIDARYVRSRPSGIGNYVAALTDRLPALAPDAHFRFWTHPERPDLAQAPNVRCVVVPAVADGLRTLLLPSVLDRLEPDDVLHFPYSLLGRGLPCPTVVTIQDLMWFEHAALVDGRPLVRRAREKFYQTGMRWAFTHATRVIATSNATADRIRAVYPASATRIRVIPLAAGPAFAAPADLQAAQREAARLVGSGAPYYIAVGKNEPYKAHDIALHAFAEAARPGELLVLVQRESSGRGIPQLARKLGVADRVRWIPPVSETNLVTLLQGATALLQPSLVEGFGLPVLEAMACGCPVIASDTPALVEVSGGAGLHARVGDAAALADQIRRLHDGSLRDELRQRGFERARIFTWDRTAAETLEVYRDVQRTGNHTGW